MSQQEILAGLNPAQIEAVTSDAPYVLVLAGAGSGKTKVIVHRIWQFIERGVSPYGILAVTFTNKAAGEMRRRLADNLATPIGNSWIGTFHSIAHRFLRQHYAEANLEQSFQVIDSDDQYRLIRRLQKNIGISEKELEPKSVQNFINSCKDKGLRLHQLEPYKDRNFKLKMEVAQAYEAACAKSGYIDFAEILLRSYELLKNNPEILRHYQNRFNAILVDEFQDTNVMQYNWMKLLAGDKAAVTIVGDDDQSIYGWRGAKIENMARFTNDFKDVQTIRLEQNYRSTQNILDAANALIANNPARLGKSLWSAGSKGDKITVYAAYDERDEAYFICSRIQHWLRNGGGLQDCAILYRSNAQSRLIEEVLVKAGINYRVYGGLRFFDRAEIKDALAYLRLIVNPNDDAAFERVVNVPKRGIGERSLLNIREHALANDQSMWQSAQHMCEQKKISPTAQNGINKFIELIESVRCNLNDASFADIMQQMLTASGLLAQYEHALSEKEKNRYENLEEMVNAAVEFADGADPDAKTPDIVSEFLAQVALDAGDREVDAEKSAVSLMTLHSAKGLEFANVFIAGLEEGLFPHAMSLHEPGRLEEERRLCYVGITRAKERLHLCYAERRVIKGFSEDRLESRFIKEIPSGLLEEIRRKVLVQDNKPKASTIINKSSVANIPFKIGQTVSHAKFGEGTVTAVEGSGNDAKIAVEFSNFGLKWLILSLAKLKAVS